LTPTSSSLVPAARRHSDTSGDRLSALQAELRGTGEGRATPRASSRLRRPALQAKLGLGRVLRAAGHAPHRWSSRPSHGLSRCPSIGDPTEASHAGLAGGRCRSPGWVLPTPHLPAVVTTRCGDTRLLSGRRRQRPHVTAMRTLCVPTALTRSATQAGYLRRKGSLGQVCPRISANSLTADNA